MIISLFACFKHIMKIYNHTLLKIIIIITNYYVHINLFALFKHTVKMCNRRTYTQIIIKYINYNIHKL